MSNETINAKNIVALHEAMKLQQQSIEALRKSVITANNNIAMLRAEIQTVKQMNAAIAGVGMGSTVHKG